VLFAFFEKAKIRREGIKTKSLRRKVQTADMRKQRKNKKHEQPRIIISTENVKIRKLEKKRP